MRYYDAILQVLGTEIVTEDEYTGTEILARLLGVDGAASGLDADLLDGNHAAAFALSGHNHTGIYQPADTDLTALATYTTVTLQTASPNDTANVLQVDVTGGTDDVDLVFIPKGTGAFLSQTPDGTEVGGNKRGQNAIDFGIERTTSTQVANGQCAINIARRRGTASGTNSINLGYNGTASGWGAINLAVSGMAEGDSAVNIGPYGTASGELAVNVGTEGEASGEGTFNAGLNGIASGDSAVNFGSYGIASGPRSVNLGYTGIAAGEASVNLGYGGVADGFCMISLGRYNIGGGTSDDWIATDPVFEIGMGTDEDHRENALKILKNGKFGLLTSMSGAGVTYSQLNVNGGQLFVGMSSTQEQPRAAITPTVTDNMNATRKYGVSISAWDTAARTGLIIEASGSAPKIGFLGTSPVVKATALTADLTHITHTEPGTPDYAIQNLVQNTGFGFVTANEGNTILKVIENLQSRVKELEDRLESIWLADIKVIATC